MVDKSKGSGKIFVYGGVLVVVAIIVVFAITGFPPSKDDTAGAIGAAKKYRAEQINESDVLLEHPELQELLQNDKVLALLQDDEFRRMISSDDFGKFISDDLTLELINRHMVDAFARNQSTEPLLSNTEYAEAIADYRIAKLAAVTNLSRSFSKDNRYSVLFKENYDLQKATKTELFYEMAKDFSAFEAMHDQDIKKVLSRDGGLEFFVDPHYVDKFKTGDFIGIIDEAAEAQIFKGTEFGKFHEDLVLHEFLQKATADGLFEQLQVKKLFTKDALANAYADDISRRVLMNKTFLEYSTEPMFRAALIKNSLGNSIDPKKWLAISEDPFLSKEIYNGKIVALCQDYEVGALFELGIIKKIFSMTAFEKLASSPSSFPNLAKLSKLSILANKFSQEPRLVKAFKKDPYVLNALVDPQLYNVAMYNKDVFNLMIDRDIMAMCTDASAFNALSDGSFYETLAEGKFEEAFNDPRFKNIQSLDIYNYSQISLAQTVYSKTDFRRSVFNPLFLKIQSKINYLEAFTSLSQLTAKKMAFRRMIENDDFNLLISDPSFVDTFRKPKNRQILESREFERLMTNLAEYGS